MAAIGCWSTPVSADVRQVDLPSSARALSTLARVDYCDAFLFDVGAPHDESAEELIREILEGAPLAVRTQLLSGWSAIGLKVGPTVRAVNSRLGNSPNRARSCAPRC